MFSSLNSLLFGLTVGLPAIAPSYSFYKQKTLCAIHIIHLAAQSWPCGLITLLVQAKRCQPRLWVVRLNDFYRSLFQITWLDNVIRIYESEDEALVGAEDNNGFGQERICWRCASEDEALVGV